MVEEGNGSDIAPLPLPFQTDNRSAPRGAPVFVRLVRPSGAGAPPLTRRKMLGDEKRAGGWFGAETINTGRADRPARDFWSAQAGASYFAARVISKGEQMPRGAASAINPASRPLRGCPADRVDRAAFRGRLIAVGARNAPEDSTACGASNKERGAESKGCRASCVSYDTASQCGSIIKVISSLGR